VSYKVSELAKVVDGVIQGDAEINISSVSALNEAQEGQISFLTGAKYLKTLAVTAASVVLLQDKYVQACPVTAVVVANPHAAFARIAQLLHPVKPGPVGIHPTVVTGNNCVIGEHVSIGPQCVLGNNVHIGSGCCIQAGTVIGDNVVLGSECQLMSNVSVMSGSRIGERVILYAGVVIGSDGFGHANDNGKWVKVPQIGHVIIEDDVEIGANSTIDRGAISNTVIESGVKLDNLVHIAHNVCIGAHTLIAAGTEIAGSTTIGKYCIIGGVVAIAGHLNITDGVSLTGRTTVMQSITKSGMYSSGSPLEENHHWRRNFTRQKQLDEMFKRLKKLEKTIETLKGKNIE